jgi:hypothetical protein
MIENKSLLFLSLSLSLFTLFRPAQWIIEVKESRQKERGRSIRKVAVNQEFILHSDKYRFLQGSGNCLHTNSSKN